MAVDATLIFHWHLRKCAGTAIRDAFAVSASTRQRPAACERCNNCMPRCVRPFYGEHHDNFASLARVRKLESRLLSHCSSMECGLRRFVVLREPYSQLLSDVNHFPPCSRHESMETCLAGDDQEAMLRRYADDYMVCGGTMMGLCKATGGGCDANATLALLRRFDLVGFVEEMHHVWAVLGAWVGCVDRHSGGVPGRAALARELTQRADAARRRARPWVSKSPTDYLRAARTALAHDEVKAAALCGGPPISEAALSTQQRSARDGQCSGALFSMNVTRVRLRALRLLPTRAQFERRNRCAIEVYWRARRELSVPTTAVRECRAGFVPLPESSRRSRGVR